MTTEYWFYLLGALISLNLALLLVLLMRRSAATAQLQQFKLDQLQQQSLWQQQILEQLHQQRQQLQQQP